VISLDSINEGSTEHTPPRGAASPRGAAAAAAMDVGAGGIGDEGADVGGYEEGDEDLPQLIRVGDRVIAR